MGIGLHCSGGANVNCVKGKEGVKTTALDSLVFGSLGFVCNMSLRSAISVPLTLNLIIVESAFHKILKEKKLNVFQYTASCILNTVH